MTLFTRLSATSPLPDQFWTQDSPNIGDSAEQGDKFGNHLSAGDFNRDGRDDVAIGISAESLGTLMDAGAVEVMYGSSAGLSATSPRPDQFWTQNRPDTTATAGALDKFGWSLG